VPALTFILYYRELIQGEAHPLLTFGFPPVRFLPVWCLESVRCVVSRASAPARGISTGEGLWTGDGVGSPGVWTVTHMLTSLAIMGRHAANMGRVLSGQRRSGDQASVQK